MSVQNAERYGHQAAGLQAFERVNAGFESEMVSGDTRPLRLNPEACPAGRVLAETVFYRFTNFCIAQIATPVPSA